MASSLDLFDVKKEINSLLSRHETKDVFDKLVQSILYHYERPVHTLSELKKRDLKTSVGTTWENFCCLWISSSGKYDAVWNLSEWREYATSLPSSYHLTKQDNGIDLVAHNSHGYHAIQCKWRKKGKVTWTSLSTFVGLCSRTGPWTTEIVMTNGTGVTSKVPRTKRDVSLCVGRFRSTKREQWLKMCGLYDEKTVASSSEVKEVVDLDEMRRARLARFS